MAVENVRKLLRQLALVLLYFAHAEGQSDAQSCEDIRPGDGLPRILQDCAPAIAKRRREVESGEFGRPPKQIPEEMVFAFTRNGTISVEYGKLFVDDSFKGRGSHYKYSMSAIQKHVKQCLDSEPVVSKLLINLEKSGLVKDRRVGVVGSQKPIIEALLLHLGAANIVTVEHNKLTLDDSRITTVEGGRFPEETFLDLVIVADALQHDGLGRYGDPVCADADLVTMDNLRRVTKTAIVSIPTGFSDKIVWNAHRIYGPIRLPLLLHGWEVKSSTIWNNGILERKVFLLQRIEEVEESHLAN